MAGSDTEQADMTKTLTTLILSFMVTTVFAKEAEDREAVMDVINAFFTGMTAKDIEGMRQIMTVDGILYGYRNSEKGPEVFSLTHAAYLENLASREGTPVERIWNPEIKIHDRIAVVWTPYDFHSDGVFSHCGVNTFSMLKGVDGWKITGVVFSVQTKDCAESPLGPLAITKQQ
jgi:hypothetical protein